MHLVELLGVVLVLSALGYPIGFMTGKLLGFDAGTLVMTFSGGMRNNNAGAVIAVTYFPSPVALPVILIMLFQQTLASFYGALLKRYVPAGMATKDVNTPRSVQTTET